MWNWDSRTHQFIMKNALKKCKKSFVHLLEIHQELLILGIEAPDRIFKDFTNHYYNCTANEYGYHYGRVIAKIDSKIEEINILLQNPQEIIIPEKYPPFLRSLLNTPLKVFIFEIGTLSHYIADLHQPLHTDGKERFDDEITIHKVFEADTRKHLDELEIFLKRRFRIKEPEKYFSNVIYNINGYYDTIIFNYYLSQGKVRPNRWIHSKQIIEQVLSLSAQNIANVCLDFEVATTIFATARRDAILHKKLQNIVDPNQKYKLIQYPSGTISLRVNK